LAYLSFNWETESNISIRIPFSINKAQI
jgi:hypothetical protein